MGRPYVVHRGNDRRTQEGKLRAGNMAKHRRPSHPFALSYPPKSMGSIPWPSSPSTWNGPGIIVPTQYGGSSIQNFGTSLRIPGLFFRQFPAEPLRQKMSQGPKLADSNYIYSAQVASKRPVTDYAIRVIPHFPGVSVPIDVSPILWQR